MTSLNDIRGDAPSEAPKGANSSLLNSPGASAPGAFRGEPNRIAQEAMYQPYVPPFRGVTPAFLAEVRQLAALIRGLAPDDPDALLDTLDGELDTSDAIGALIALRDAALAAATAAKARKEAWAAREKAAADHEQAVRRQITRLMEAIGERTIKHPLATLTMRAGKPELILTEDAAARLPDELVRVKREPDRAAIRAALEAGGELDGCALGNAAPSLTIRSA